MPGTGFEPARDCSHQHLKLARLPISPPGRRMDNIPRRDSGEQSAGPESVILLP